MVTLQSTPIISHITDPEKSCMPNVKHFYSCKRCKWKLIPSEIPVYCWNYVAAGVWCSWFCNVTCTFPVFTAMGPDVTAACLSLWINDSRLAAQLPRLFYVRALFLSSGPDQNNPSLWHQIKLQRLDWVEESKDQEVRKTLTHTYRHHLPKIFVILHLGCDLLWELKEMAHVVV